MQAVVSKKKIECEIETESIWFLIQQYQNLQDVTWQDLNQ
jgi:hypothetical protein